MISLRKLKNTKKGDFTDRILWASDAPVGDFNQHKELYVKNLAEFQTGIFEYFKDKELLDNLMYGNAAKLFGL